MLIPGQLTSRRHINLPGVKVNLPAFTEKDRGDTLVGLEEGIDFVALSFVREAADVEQLREFLTQKQIAGRASSPKSRTSPRIANLDEIVQSCRLR